MESVVVALTLRPSPMKRALKTGIETILLALWLKYYVDGSI